MAGTLPRPEGRPAQVCDTKAEARERYVEDVGRHAGGMKGWAAPELGRIMLRKWAEDYMSTVVDLPLDDGMALLAGSSTSWPPRKRQLNQRPRSTSRLAGRAASGRHGPRLGPSRDTEPSGRLLQVAVDKGVIARSPRAGR